MNPNGRIGIVGGYGSTGRVVASELWKSCSGEICLAGRNLTQAEVLAAGFDTRVSAAQLDILDAQALNRFCQQCSIIVNCGGPVSRLQDQVAQAALSAECHYVDLAGLSMVKERLIPRAQEMANRGLSFVVSAGWLPGLTELLPMYAHALATTRMDTIESLEVYFGDSGDWSTSAYQDMAWFLRQTGLRSPGYFQKGERVAVKMRHGTPCIDLGGRIGLRRFALQSLPEQDAIGRRLNSCDFYAYNYLPSSRMALAAALVALIPMPQGWGVRLLKRAFRRSSLPVGGFVVARVQGRSHGDQITLTTDITYNKHCDYWMNGVVAGTVARLVLEGKGVRPGVHFLSEAIDPIAFMGELRRAGVEQREKIELAG